MFSTGIAKGEDEVRTELHGTMSAWLPDRRKPTQKKTNEKDKDLMIAFEPGSSGAYVFLRYLN